MSESLWYETFFQEDYLRAYGPFFSEMDVSADVDLLFDELGLEIGMRILDLCCGQGRHAVPLAARGLEVTGQDLSACLLAAAKEAAREAGVRVEFVERDMRKIPSRDHFDAVINMFTAFGYFDDDEENLRVLRGVARALKPGGHFALDVVSYSWLMRHWEATGWTVGEDGLMHLQERGMDWVRGIQETKHTFIESTGDRRTLTTRLRLYPSHELVALLEKAGFEVLKLLGGPGGMPYGPDTQRLIVVSRKPVQRG